MKTLADNIKQYEPAISLTRLLSRKTLSLIRKASFITIIFSSLLTSASFFFYDSVYINYLLGILAIATAVWLEQMLIFSYHNSYYYKGLNSLIGLESEDTAVATYDVSEVVLKNPSDVTLAFCTSTFGTSALLRSGMTSEVIDNFLHSKRRLISADLIMLPEDELFSLIGLGKYLLTHDVDFKKMFREAGIQEEIFLGALRWVVGSYLQEKRRLRWWSKDNLSQTIGIGREWAYGTAYTLNRYSRNIQTGAVFSTLGSDSSFASEKISEIESALARDISSNVLIMGEAGVGIIDLVIEVSHRMKLGKSLGAIAGKQIVVLDTNRLFANLKDKHDFEVTLLNILDEALLAGNIIIVIENISNFIREANAMGVFVPELLDEYLALPQIQIIATDTPASYHTYLETLGGFVHRFAEVLVDSPDLDSVTRILQDIALATEAKRNILFTYPSLRAITTSADRYIVNGVMPAKAIELLVDIANKAQQTNTIIVTEDFVFETVTEQTGVPTGPIQDSERTLLLNLEDELHRRVVGQDMALNAIGRTMRRARAGIQSSDKPIGSFLFLGPTGVGKTETAKALAKIFFGGEQKMQRLDMSEYSGEDALAQLIGDGVSAGTLPNILREHPYCVLLLDEFEKAHQSIHDLFLQILDEGIFTDSRGMKINARNTIIIATSNAGSQLILRTVQQRKALSTLTQEIINNIIESGIYRPELINRFDSTIIFEPLTIEQQSEVASLMLGGLYERIKERGYEVTISRDLLAILVEKGYSPEYGARPMQRVLQDIIEEKIAQKIISGEAKKGSSIILSRADFSEKELEVAGT
jgi:ATP-dependent Clp protease ATP-binding subunit ClpC